MRKAQSTMDYLMLLGLILIIIVTIMFFTWKPREDIAISQGTEALETISEYSNNIAELGPGNKIRTKIEIPNGVKSINYHNGEINMVIFANATRESDVHKQTKTPVTGFLQGNVSPGIYDLIFESLGVGVCIYPPEQREEYCYCFNDEFLDGVIPTFFDILKYGGNKLGCEINSSTGSCKDSDIEYGDVITGLTSQCLSAIDGDVIVAAVTYNITNWKGELVFPYEDELEKGVVSSSDSDGFFTASDFEYEVANSGPLKLTAKCYHECFYVRPDREDLIAETNITIYVPYGTIVPFLLDAEGNKIYSRDLSHYYLVDPLNEDKSNYNYGWVRKDDKFIIRTGYDCVGGECIMVDASLYHGGTK